MSDEQDIENPEAHVQFSKLADLARKSTEDHIATFTAASIAPLLDPYNLKFAVLCGVVSASVTALVGAADVEGDDSSTQAASLNTLVGQMAGVFNEIQERKALIASTAAATPQ